MTGAREAERWTAAAADDAVLRDRQSRPVFTLDPDRLAIFADPEAVATVAAARALARQLVDELVTLAAIAHQGYVVAMAASESGRQGESRARVARRFGIDASTLFRWASMLNRAKSPTRRTIFVQDRRPGAMGTEGAAGEDTATKITAA